MADRLRPYLPWVVLFWMMGVAALSARQMTAWGMVQRLRRRWVRPVEARWTEVLARLSARLGVSRPVRLLESVVLESPAMIGWLKPVILLPAGMLTGLMPDQIEAILAHELAHIRRHDYLVNLIQSAIETLLFYHPAVWWVGRRLREERELCCDDLAVGILGDARGYALALTRMEELRMESSDYAMALTGGSLMKRIRRLLGLREEDRDGAQWLAGLLTGLALIAMVTLMTLGGAPRATAGLFTGNSAKQDASAVKVDPSIEKMPGYVAFEASKIVGDRKPVVDVNLNQALMQIALGAARETQPELVETINALNLYLLQVRIYEKKDDKSAEKDTRTDAAASQGVTDMVSKLSNKGWLMVFQSVDGKEHVHVMMRAEGKQILGFTTLVTDGSDVIFGNLVCNVEADRLGKELGGLLNKAMSGKLDLSDLQGLGLNMNFGAGGGGKSSGSASVQIKQGPQWKPDGFKTGIEAESLKLTDAEVVKAEDASGGKAIKFNSESSVAAGSIKLDPGHYQARVIMKRDGLDHDAIYCLIGAHPKERVYREGDGFGRVAQKISLDIATPSDVKIELQAAESGMLIDRIDFFRCKKEEASAGQIKLGAAAGQNGEAEAPLQSGFPGALQLSRDQGEVSTRDQVMHLQFTPGGQLKISNKNGAVHVSTWDRKDIQIIAALKMKVHPGAAFSPPEDLAGYFNRLNVGVEGASDQLTVRTQAPESRQGVDLEVNYEVLMPAQAAVTVEQDNGQVSANGINGSLDVYMANGQLQIKNVTGKIHSQVSNGNIESVDSYGEVGYMLSNGRIEVRMAKAPGEKDSLTCQASTGRIAVALPGRSAFDLKARTNMGRIGSDFFNVPSGRGAGHEFQQQVAGGGAKIDLDVSTGSIDIRKSAS